MGTLRQLPGLALAALLVVGAAPSWADDATSDESTGDADGDELVVYGDLIVAQKRRALDRRLRASGYRAGKRKDGKTVYEPEAVWKPTVVVHDDGFVVMRRSRVRFEPWAKGRSKLVWVSCIPPFTLMCIRLGGRMVSPARLEAQKERTLAAMDKPLDDWQAALMATGMQKRVQQELPDQLDRLWADGTRLDNAPGEPLPTPEQRRQAMLDFWADRSCTPEGAQVREVVALFLEYEVQPSPWPVTAAELAAAQAAHRCGDVLNLTVSAPLDATEPPP